MPTSPDALLAQDVDQAGRVAVDHPDRGEAIAQILEQRPIELDHDQRLGRQAGLHQALRDRAGAGAELDDHLARPPDDLLADRTRQRARRRDHRAHRLGRAQPLAEEELGFLGLAYVDLTHALSPDRSTVGFHRVTGPPAELGRRAGTAPSPPRGWRQRTLAIIAHVSRVPSRLAKPLGSQRCATIATPGDLGNRRAAGLSASGRRSRGPAAGPCAARARRRARHPAAWAGRGTRRSWRRPAAARVGSGAAGAPAGSRA